MPSRPMFALAALALAGLLESGPAAGGELPVDARYVAMGSSFAAGPGIAASADTPETRCRRSADNYAHVLARKLRLRLVDASCSGAKATDILAPWEELPPQIAAVTAETQLVTITVGGNDLNYMASIIAMACENDAAQAAAGARASGTCPKAALPSSAEEAALAGNLKAIVTQVRQRAPKALILLVQYFTLMPREGSCLRSGLTTAQAARLRAVAAALSAITTAAARETGAGLVALDQHSADHGMCAAAPWVNGARADPQLRDGVLFHPNRAGMMAAARLIEDAIAAAAR